MSTARRSFGVLTICCMCAAAAALGFAPMSGGALTTANDGAPAELSLGRGALTVPAAGWLDGGLQAYYQTLAERADPQAVFARERSRTQYEHLSGGAVARAIDATQPQVVAAAPSGLLNRPRGARIARYLSLDAAQLSLADGHRAIALSATPIATSTGSHSYSPIDLGLKQAGSSFEPIGSAVAVSIPQRLSAGAQLPGVGVSLTPTRASGAALAGLGRLDRGVVLYANTQRDTDTTIKPLAAGLETDTVLRSIGSPQQLSFRVGVPVGARLVASAGALGGAEVIAGDGRVLASIPTPTAHDAAGAQVPVSTRVVGRTLRLQVDHRSGDYRYPIAVDPTVIDSDLYRYYGESGQNWRCESKSATCSQGHGTLYTGLEVGSVHVANDWAALLYPTQGESHIYELSAESEASMGSANVELKMGIAKPGTEISKASWDAVATLPTAYSRTISTVCVVPSTCALSGGTAANVAAFFVSTLGEGSSGVQKIFAASTYIAQANGPTIAADTTHEKVEGLTNVLYGSGAWLGPNVESAAEFDMTDPGVGIHEFEYKIVGGTKWKDNLEEYLECAGPVQCPESIGRLLRYQAVIPDGEPTIEVKDVNAMGSSATTSVKLKVDSTAPHEIALTGLPAGNEISDANRNLKLIGKATDGVSGTPSSGVASLKLAVDGREIGSANGKCSPGPCIATGEWTITGEEFGAGKHTFTLTATDAAGNTASSETTFTVHHAAPVSLGPGSLNPITGEFDLEATDASIADLKSPLQITRNYNSREPAGGSEGPLGAPWSLSFGGAQEFVRNPGGSMTLISASGTPTTFYRRIGTYESPAGDKNLVLTSNAGETEFTLSDNGATTAFKHVSGDVEGVYRASFTSTTAGTSTSQYTYQVVGGVIEPSEELGPVPAGVSCAPSLKPGCRALTFNYATATTATGEGSSQWGDYTGRLTRVYFATAESNGSEEKQVTTTVAQYAYDSKGRLRAVWDPRVSPALKTTYGYDAEGHVTAITPPGKESLAFTYGTIGSDTSSGRLLKFTRPSASTALWDGSGPANTAAPKVGGTPVVGARMSTTDGSWSHSPITYGYQWEDCNWAGAECKAIAGATNANYTPVAADVGHRLVTQVTATNGGGSVTATSAASSPVETAASDSASVTQSVEANGLNAVSCVPSTTDCVVSDSKGNAYYATNVNTSTAATWTSWTGPSGHSPSEALACPTTSLCMMAAGSDGSSRYGGNMYYATSLGGAWLLAFSPGYGTDAVSCPSSSFCATGQNENYIRYSTEPASTSWNPEDMGVSTAMKGISCLSSSFCAVVDASGNVHVATTLAQVESATWKKTNVDGTTALNGVTCTSTSSCVAVDTAGSVLNLAIAENGAATVTKQNIDGSNSLTAVTCNSSTCVTVDNKGNVFISRDSGKTWLGEYQLKDDLTGVSCPSTSLCATVDTTGHDMTFNPSANPIVEGESRSPQPGVTVEYGVPVSGTGAPYALGGSEVSKWAQTDAPVEATAIFATDEPMGWPASDYRRATVDYFDSADRLVNAASPGGGIATTEYNSYNDVVRNLTADNREAALKEGSKSAEASQTLDTQSTYGSEGTELLSTLEPLHTVKLASGATVKAREHIVYSYDEGAPSSGGPYRLVTKVTEGAQISGEPEADVRTTVKSYAGQNNLGWVLREPTATNVDPSGLKLIHSTVYDPVTGNVLETRTPGAGAPSEEILSGYIYKATYAARGCLKEHLNKPGAITTDAQGNYWVANTADSCVEEFSSGGTFVREFGIFGTGEGQLKEPKGIAIDGEGNVWVADTGNNRVEEFSSTGSYIKQYYKPRYGEIGLKSPTGLAYYAKSNTMYVADTGDNDIKELLAETGGVKEPIVLKGEFGSSGTGNGQFKSPEGVAVDGEGYVRVADTGNNRVQEFSEEGGYISQFGALGSGNGQLNKPEGLALDSKGDVLVADGGNNRIESFSAAGAYQFQFGTAGSGEKQFKAPADLALDSSDEAYVVDTGNSRVEKWLPAGLVHERGGTGGTHGTQTVYYTVGENSEVSSCGNKPEWAGLPCEKRPAAQPETSGLPNLPVTTTTYNVWEQPLVSTETVGTTTRTNTNVYDEAGRLTKETVSSSIGTALPSVSFEYSTETGGLVKTSTTVEGVTKTLESKYDRLGGLSSYQDSDGNTSTYTYDQYERVESINDGKGTQTYGYDNTTGFLTKLVDSAAGTFTATYDAEGNLTTVGYPNGMNVNHTYDQTGNETGIEYVKTTHCSSGCVWYSQTESPSIHGQTLSQTSTLSSQTYTYDEAGRLTEAQDTPAGEGCTSRIYALDEETNIISLTTRAPGGEGKCASEGGTVANHSYDAADRLTDAGIGYDTFGDITKLPAGDAGGSEVTSSYYVDETLASQTQNGQTIGYYLDPSGRDRQIVSTGTTNSTVTYHYADSGRSPAWTEDTAGKWTRNIYGLEGLVAIQTGGESPVLQIQDLKGSIVGTASLSETATGLLSKGDSTEYGVPRTSSPPKYSWQGAFALRTELPSGIIAMGARSYVPEIGRFLQPDPIEGGSANAYAYTYGDPVNSADPSGEFTVATPSWVSGFFQEEAEAATEAAIQRAAEEQAAREEAEEKAREAAEEAVEAAEATAESGSRAHGKGKKAKEKKAAKANSEMRRLMTRPPRNPGHKNCLPGEVRVGNHCEKGPGPKHRPSPPKSGPPGSPIVPIPPIVHEGLEDCYEIGICDI